MTRLLAVTPVEGPENCSHNILNPQHRPFIAVSGSLSSPWSGRSAARDYGRAVPLRGRHGSRWSPDPHLCAPWTWYPRGSPLIDRLDRHIRPEHAVPHPAEDGAARAAGPSCGVAHGSTPMHSSQSNPSISTGLAPQVAQTSASSSLASGSTSVAAVAAPSSSSATP
jgi:hypothetical protein